MKHFKHLLFLSILCSLVLFTNCGEDSDLPADTPTNTTDDSTDDDSTTVLDADGDGVADADDTCAETPSGETVDSSGCSDSQISRELYGYEDSEKSIYRIDPSNGEISKVIELEHNVDWNLVYDNSSNKIIGSSEQNSGGGMVSLIVVDLTSNSVTYPDFQYTSEGQRITELVYGIEF